MAKGFLRDLAARSCAASIAVAASCAAVGIVCSVASASSILRATLGPPAVEQVLYAVDGQGVDVFTAGRGRPTFVRTISSGLESPNDVCVDKAGTLYVADELKGIVEYPRGSSQPAKTITLTGIDIPSNINVGADGSITVGFLDVFNSRYYGVRQYSASGKVEREIDYTGSNIYVTGVAGDAAGNLYVADGADVLVYAPGQRQPFAKLAQASFTGALAIDRAGQLLVGQPYLNRVVTEALPSGQIVGSVLAPGGGVYLTLDAVAGELYAVSEGGSLEYFNYRTGKPLGTMSTFRAGIAVDPTTELFK